MLQTNLPCAFEDEVKHLFYFLVHYWFLFAQNEVCGAFITEARKQCKYKLISYISKQNDDHHHYLKVCSPPATQAPLITFM